MAVLRCLLLCAALPLLAEDAWVEFRSGPFEVLTDTGERNGRNLLNQLEQFRYALGQTVGKSDLRVAWPVRIVLLKSAKNTSAATPALRFARDSYLASVRTDAPFPTVLQRSLAELFLPNNAIGLPGPLSRGLVQVFSTVNIVGTRVTLGAPPADRTPDWALAHLITVSPQYHGRVRVFFSNLAQGADLDTASRNAFERTYGAITEEAGRYATAGQFETVSAPSRPIASERDFTPKPVTSIATRLAAADLLLIDPSHANAAAVAYRALPAGPEPLEGLGLLAERAGQTGDARQQFSQAVAQGSRNARAYVELAKLTPEAPAAKDLLRKAADLNPQWDVTFAELARREATPREKVPPLRKAAELAPGNVAYWRELALALQGAEQFAAATKAWSSAEHAATSEDERTQLRAERSRVDEQRVQQEAEERRRAAEARERELQRVKDQAIARIRAAEDRARQKSAAEGAQAPADKPIPWEELPGHGAKVSGTLQRIDCIRGSLRLVLVGDDQKPISLWVPDPKQLGVLGGETALACGPQAAKPHVTVEYSPKQNARTGTAGEAGTIEFR